MFAAAGLFLVTPSCKKGEEDPALSLSSRKARLAGEWTVTYFKSISTWDNGAGDSSSYTQESNDGKTQTNTSVSTSGGVAGTPQITTTTIDLWEMTINKDGSYTEVKNTTEVTVTDLGGGVTSTDTEVRTRSYSGSWSFVGKDKTGDYKKNERVIFTVTLYDGTYQNTNVYNDNGTATTTVGDLSTSNETYLTGEWVNYMDILQLKGKEVKLVLEGDNTDINTTTGGGTTVSTTTKYTDLTEITLTAK